MIKSLITLKDHLIRQACYTSAVDDILIKLLIIKKKKLKLNKHKGFHCITIMNHTMGSKRLVM